MRWSPLITHVAKLFRANSSGTASSRNEKVKNAKGKTAAAFIVNF
jgi:hypothetical protein